MKKTFFLTMLMMSFLVVLAPSAFADDGDDGWELAETLKDADLTIKKTGPDGKPEKQWTYKGIYFIWLLLTKDCRVRPCYERK